MLVCLLKDTVEALEDTTVTVRESIVGECIEQGLVVLVDEDHGTPASVCVCPDDEVLEAIGKGLFHIDDSPYLLQLPKLSSELRLKSTSGGVVGSVEVEVEDWVGRPGSLTRRLEREDLETLEELRPTLPVCLEGGHQEALAEAPGTGQEGGNTGAGNLPDVCRLVYVSHGLLSKLDEVLDARGNPASHTHLPPSW